MRRKIRVLHTITTLSLGGAEAMLYKLLYHTRQESHFQQHVLSLADKNHYGHLLEAINVPVYALKLRNFPENINNIIRFNSVLKRWNPTVMVSWLYHADLFSTLIAKISGRQPILWNIRCSNMKLSDYSILTRLVFTVLKKLSYVPEVVVANSVSGKLYHQMAGYHPKRWVVLPNGFDTRLFKPDKLERNRFRQQSGYTDTCPIIGMVARFDPMKDHALFFEVAGRIVEAIGEARFVLIGKGMDRRNVAISRLIEKSGLAEKVALMGVQNDLHRIYPALDLMLSTSSFGEGFPNVVGEALSCGVPVVATDVGDTERIVGTAGAVVPHGDPLALAGACVRLLGLSPDEKASISQAARNRITAHYAIDQICQKYIALLTELGSEG